jgi:uncharacterized membrane protein YfcA
VLEISIQISQTLWAASQRRIPGRRHASANASFAATPWESYEQHFGDAPLPNHDVVLASARAARAAFVSASAATFIARMQSRSLATVLLLALVNAGLLIVYAQLLPAAGVAGLSIVVLLAIFFASALSSVAGFAFSAICGAILFHLMTDQVRIVETMIICSIAIQVLSVWTLRSAIDWRVLPAFVAGGLLGLPIGVWLLLHLSQQAYVRGMGVALVLYGAYMLFRRPVHLRRDFGTLGDAAAGVIGGVTGGLAGFPGALVTIWCGVKGWDKRRQRGVYQPFILIVQVAGLIAIHLMRSPGSTGLDPVVWAYVPAALLGTWCGLALFTRLTDRQFAIAVNLLLIVSGIGLTGLL